MELLTHKQLEMHGCILSTVTTDALALKLQAISIHSADNIFIELDQFHAEILVIVNNIRKHNYISENKANLRDLKAATGLLSGNAQFGSKAVMFCPV